MNHKMNSIKKKIDSLTKQDIEKISVWDQENAYLIPFFFDSNQELLIPLYHDVVPAIFYVKAKIFKDTQYLGIAKYSNDLFYLSNDFQNLDIHFFENEDRITKLKDEHLPIFLKIDLKTYPFFNNYIILLTDLQELQKVASFFSIFFHQIDNLNILLTGDLGTGKTEFVKKIIPSVSPSFNILFSYKKNHKIINHWDLYRIEPTTENLQDLDFWFYLNQDNTLNLIEWANKIKLEYYISNTDKKKLLCINLSFHEVDYLRYMVISFFEEFIAYNELIKEFLINFE